MKKIIFLLMLGMLCNKLSGQTTTTIAHDSQNEFTPKYEGVLYAGTVIPLGAFKDKEEGVGAKPGFGLAFESIWRFSPHVGLLSHLGLTYNSAKDIIDFESNWLNLYLMGGLKFETQISKSNNRIYGLGLVGFTSVFPSGSMDNIYIYDYIANDDYWLSIEASGNNSSNFTYGFGAGVLINEKIDVGLRYFGANQEFEVESTLTAVGGFRTTSGTSIEENKLAVLELVVGIHF